MFVWKGFTTRSDVRGRLVGFFVSFLLHPKIESSALLVIDFNLALTDLSTPILFHRPAKTTCCCFHQRAVTMPFSQQRAWLVEVSPWLRPCFPWLSLLLLLLTPGSAPPATRPSCAAVMPREVPANTQSGASLLMACMTCTCPPAIPSTRRSCAAPSTLLGTACTEAAASSCTVWRSKGRFGSDDATCPVAHTVLLGFAPLAHVATSCMLRVVRSRMMQRRKPGVPLPGPVNGNPMELSAVPSVLSAFACTARAAGSSMASPIPLRASMWTRHPGHHKCLEGPYRLLQICSLLHPRPLPPLLSPCWPRPRSLMTLVLLHPRLQKWWPTTPSPSAANTWTTCCCRWPSDSSSWNKHLI